MILSFCNVLHLQRYIKFVLLAQLVFFILTSCNTNTTSGKLVSLDESTKSVPEVVDFTFDVKPIISDRCFKCHGPDKNAIEGGLSLNSPEDAYKALGELKDHFAIVPKDVEKSTLVERIYSEDPNLKMPPPESNLELTEYEKAILKKWIAQGAEYKAHWAFSPPVRPEIPAPKENWGNNEIDNFILAKLDQNGITPNERASKEKLIRRISFDLTGLPPSVIQIQNFLGDNS